MVALAVALAALSPAFADAAPKQPKGLPASSWMLVDARSGDVLARHGPSAAHPVASATKLMTALLALRALRPSETVTASAYDAGPAESLMGLEAGERVSVRDLLYGLLVPSGNDAAVTLALRVAGSVPDFVERMNDAARRLDLNRTSYTDPGGLDQGNVSSARDLIALTRRLRGSALFRRIVDTARITVGKGPDRHRLVNRNTLLLEEPYIDGVKTGTTLAAGYVLVASGERRGVELVSAVLGAPDEERRDAATSALMDYGFALYRERRVVRAGEPVASLALGDGRGRLRLVTGASLTSVARSDQAVEVDFAPPAPPDGAVARGDRLGVATVTIDGREIGRLPVVAAEAAPAALPEDSGMPAWAVFALVGAGVLSAASAIAAIVVSRRAPR